MQMSRENDSKQRGKYSRLKQVACTKMLKMLIFERGKRNGSTFVLRSSQKICED